MEQCAKKETVSLKNAFIAEYYPDIEKYHKNELLTFFDSVNREYLIRRKEQSIIVKNKEQLEYYIKKKKEQFESCLGQMPEKIPVNSKKVKTLDRDRYYIDNILIESYPGTFLTANFYYPKSIAGKLPAIMLYCGHSTEGKAYHMYVAFCIEAVLNGFCVLTFDPVGQGERKMYDSKDSDIFKVHDPDQVHYLLGQQASIAGENLTKIMMWDNIRALDYLCTRNEVDTKRIAVGGNSGGGQMAAFAGAYDTRPAAVFSCCYITELAQLSYEIGMQECEQSMPGFVEKLLSLADLAIAAAPKPFFIGAALFDFFPINGTRDAFIEIKRMYKIYEKEDNLEIYVAQKPHGFWWDMREKALEFLCRHFDVEFIENKGLDYENLPQEQDLLCTKDGNISTCNSISLQKVIEGKWEEIRPVYSINSSGSDFDIYKKMIRDKVIDVLRISPDKIEIRIDRMQTSYDTGCEMTVTDIAFYSEEHMKVYCTLYEKKGICQSRVLINAGALDINSSSFGELINTYTIMCIETRGTYRSKVDDKSWFYDFEPKGYRTVEASYNCNAVVLGRSILGMRVLDILAGIQVLHSFKNYENAGLVMYGNDEAAIYALFAAVIKEVDEVRLGNFLFSYGDIVKNRIYLWEPSIFAYDILKYFDIPDLVTALLPSNIYINHLLNHKKEQISQIEAEQIFKKALEISKLFNGRSHINISC